MQLLTLAEVARRLGVSEKLARVLVAEMPTVRVGKRFRYREDYIADFIQNGGSHPRLETTAQTGLEVR